MFYLRRPVMGLLYLCTLGGFGLMWLTDAFRLPLLYRAWRQRYDPSRPSVSRAEVWMLYLNPLGLLFGAHYWAIGMYGWGVAYTCTLGLFGLGWLTDFATLHHSITLAERRRTNPLIDAVDHTYWQTGKLLYNLTGLLGLYNAYLGRYLLCIASFFTLNGLGCWWIADVFRIRWLVRTANSYDRFANYNLFEAYKFWFPLGLFGAHHFYLGNYRLGLIYFFTVGLLGLGWIYDAFALPAHVRTAQALIAPVYQPLHLQSGDVKAEAQAGQTGAPADDVASYEPPPSYGSVV